MRWSVLAVALAVFFCEFAYYVLKVGLCNWAALPAGSGGGAPSPLRLLLVSDVHVLGARRRLWVERAWVDWQLRKSFALLSWLTRPHAVLVLGDMLDEGGGFTGDALWHAYRERYGAVAGSGAVVGSGARGAGAPPHLHVVGNHDTGWAGRLSPWLIQRFERSFGAANAAFAMRADGTIAAAAEFELAQRASPAQRQALESVFAAAATDGFVLVRTNSMALDGGAPAAVRQQTLRFLRAVGEARGGAQQHRPAGGQPPLVLLTHMPLFRSDDRDCGAARAAEVGHVTYAAPGEPLGEDVVTKADTQWLLRTLRPSLVLSGHTHTACFYVHESEAAPASAPVQELWRRRWRDSGEWAGGGAGADVPEDVPELTASTLSWGMRPDPAFAVLSMARGTAARGPTSVAARICSLPDERVIFGVYALVAASVVAGALARCFRSRRADPPAGAKQH